MIKTKMLHYPLFVQTESRLWGSHAQGWFHDLDSQDSLPRFSDLESSIPKTAWDEKKAVVLLPEVACFPIKVKIEEKIQEKDRETYLKWNLKKRLPFPSEDAMIRYIPLADGQNWLVFSLPGTWVDETFKFFKSKGVHLGYIGSITGLFLERMSDSNGQALLAFDHYYVYFEKKGGLLRHFQLRRFPEEDGRILFEEFFPHDFDMNPVHTPKVFCFSNKRLGEWQRFQNSSANPIASFFEVQGNLALYLKSLGKMR